MSQGKHWCITLNNPDDGECLGWSVEEMQYLICGKEVGKEGTPHLQGYVQFKKKKKLSAVKKFWPRAHLELAKGKPDQNVTYCSKEHQWHDHGECLKGQGSRSDLENVKKRIDEGCTISELRDEHYATYIRYQRQLTVDREFNLPNRSWPTELHIYWGASGSGKSRKCFEDWPDAYWKTRGEWWDGYDGQETIIIDEFYGWLPIDTVLRLCDRYPLQLQVKGGFRKCVAKRVIFTSNKPWEEWWNAESFDKVKPAFLRRITSCTEFKLFSDLHG